MARILLVEDEQHLADGLKFNLNAEGHETTVAATGEQALATLKEDPHGFGAVILDVMLPGVNGFEVARELRKAGNFVPILMLTARGRPEDVLEGFEAGADDYLPKPFDIAILMARLSGLLRRSQWSQPHKAAALGDTFAFDGKTLDFERLELHVGKEVYPLTLMEVELLRYLIRNAGKPVSRKAILHDVWNLSEDTDTRAIDNFVARLRKYIEKSPPNPKHLLTVRGVGYKFVP